MMSNSNVQLVFVVLVVFLFCVIYINHLNHVLFVAHNHLLVQLYVVVKKMKHLLILCLLNDIKKVGYLMYDMQI
jgi:hypothetical protein